MCKNLSNFIRHLTIEPVLFLYTAVFVTVELTCLNLLIQKKCRFNVTSEPDLNIVCDDEKRGITYATEITTYFRFIMYFLSSLYAALAMSWSDEAGRRRRPVIFSPIIGLIFQSLCGCLQSYFWTWDPFNSALWNVILEVIGGGIALMNISSQAYVCDVSDVKSRTMRMGLYSAARTLGDLAGFGSSGFMLRKFGFFYTYLICFILSIITLVLGLIFVKDVSVRVEKKRYFWQAFNLMRIVDSFKVVFKKSLGKKRTIVAALLTTYVLVFFSTQGENSVQYLFLRYKFHWNESDYSLYVIYRFIGVFVGSVISSIVLSKLLKMHDGVIGMISGLWDMIAAFGYLFASQNWHLYVVPLFDIFHVTALSVSISFFSKFYEADEIGRLSCVLGVLTLLIAGCHPSYCGFFQITLDFFPSAYFTLSIFMNIIVISLYLLSYLLIKKIAKQETSPKEEKPMIDY